MGVPLKSLEGVEVELKKTGGDHEHPHPHPHPHEQQPAGIGLPSAALPEKQKA